MSARIFTERDLSRWSWKDAVQCAAQGRVTGVVAEFDQELRKTWFGGVTDQSNRHMGDAHTFLVPNEILRRDLTVAGTGGYLVETENVGFLDMLAPLLPVARLGATRLTGLVGNVTIPRMSDGMTAHWLPTEGSTIGESQPTLGQVALVPKMVGAYCEFTRQLMLQSVPTVNKVIANHIVSKIAIEINTAAVAGAGSSGEPQGIIGTPNIGSFTGTSLDLAALLNAQGDLGGGDVDVARAAYLTTPAVAAVLMARQKFTGSDRALWEGSLSEGQVAGLRAMASTVMPSATMILGAFEHLILAEWGAPLEITVNPFAGFATGIVGMRGLALIDIAVAHPAAFSVASSIT